VCLLRFEYGGGMSFELSELNKVFGAAAVATYAGGGGYTKPWNSGFNELEYRQGDWHYRDSYTGFFKSFGREVIWYKDSPVWTQHYGGGMEPEYKGNKVFTSETFQFLKLALGAGDKQAAFQPRGPREFTKGDWTYRSGFRGNIAKFNGSEEIFFNNKLVFTHHYFGGIVIDKE
jgi:hypothetical protein